MLDRIFPFCHLILKAKSPKHLASFACQRFANVKPRELFLFQNDWLNSFPHEEHCHRGPPRPAADY